MEHRNFVFKKLLYYFLTKKDVINLRIVNSNFKDIKGNCACEVPIGPFSYDQFVDLCGKLNDSSIIYTHYHSFLDYLDKGKDGKKAQILSDTNYSNARSKIRGKLIVAEMVATTTLFVYESLRLSKYVSSFESISIPQVNPRIGCRKKIKQVVTHQKNNVLLMKIYQIYGQFKMIHEVEHKLVKVTCLDQTEGISSINIEVKNTKRTNWELCIIPIGKTRFKITTNATTVTFENFLCNFYQEDDFIAPNLKVLNLKFDFNTQVYLPKIFIECKKTIENLNIYANLQPHEKTQFLHFYKIWFKPNHVVTFFPIQ